jgi:hypothetical protein
MTMEILGNRPGIVVKLLTDDDQECHACGAIGRPRRLIYLDHLCQHYVGLCEVCFEYLAVVLGLVAKLPQQETLETVERHHEEVVASITSLDRDGREKVWDLYRGEFCQHCHSRHPINNRPCQCSNDE